MEAWGIGALAANKLDVAEEAFLEALAHDAGSMRAAMGLQVLCERQNRSGEALRRTGPQVLEQGNGKGLRRRTVDAAPPLHRRSEDESCRSETGRYVHS